MRKWYADHPERVKQQAKRWRERKIARMSPEELKAFRLKESSKTKRDHLLRKERVYAAYGGYECACCGETQKEFLSIDHIRNDGYEMFKKGIHPRGTGFYIWLCKNNFPEGFQVLCMNCQFGKKHNNGVCPHMEGVEIISKESTDKRPEAHCPREYYGVKI